LFFFYKIEPPDFQQGIVLRGEPTVEQVCTLVHKDLLRKFKFALVWGRSAKHTPQKGMVVRFTFFFFVYLPFLLP
jgi:ribosome-interacting GTPase 1